VVARGYARSLSSEDPRDPSRTPLRDRAARGATTRALATARKVRPRGEVRHGGVRHVAELLPGELADREHRVARDRGVGGRARGRGLAQRQARGATLSPCATGGRVLPSNVPMTRERARVVASVSAPCTAALSPLKRFSPVDAAPTSCTGRPHGARASTSDRVHCTRARGARAQLVLESSD
jgi:hypothetical protein